MDRGDWNGIQDVPPDPNLECRGDLAWWKETHRLGIGIKSPDRGIEISCGGTREGHTRQGHWIWNLG